MKLGIMQPYFIPYIGYWQLMNAVDKYVVYDDVNYIKGGWVSRNRILNNGKEQYFNIPMLGASPNKLINEIHVNNNENVILKNVRILEAAYRKAPYYSNVMPLMERVIHCNKETISEYILESFHLINEYLGITTELILSSQLSKDTALRAQDKVIAICKELGATEYYNAIGGKELYSFDDFSAEGIELRFVRTNAIVYKQFDNEFIPNLSIVDVMMFNPKESIRTMLKEYELVSGCEE